MRPFVIYWNNIPSPYMVERFNALADRGLFEFEAWFNDRIESDRSWEVNESTWRFQYRYIPSTRIGRHVLHWPLPLLGRRPDLLVSLYAQPSFLFGWLLASIRRIKTGFWVEVTFDRWIQRNSIKESMKRWLFPKVDAIITVGDDGKHFSERYGAHSEKIFFAPHSIDVKHYMESSESYSEAKQKELRDSLGLKGVTFIYVGRLWWGKGLNYLLEAFSKVQTQVDDEVSLLFVGDGPDEAKLKRQCEEQNIRNVIFAGFKQKPELPHFYAVSDVFVFPTLGDPYGLVVDEAMACSLPIISTSSAGEIGDRIEEGINGYIVPPVDAEALAKRMLLLARDTELRRHMGGRSLDKIKGHTPEKWAEDFEKIVHHLLRDSRI